MGFVTLFGVGVGSLLDGNVSLCAQKDDVDCNYDLRVELITSKLML